MNKFGPTRGEYIFRLCFAVFGLSLLAAVILIHGVPEGPAFAEAILIGGGFFGFTLIHSIRALMRGAGK